jgi:hypothetical protein
MNGFKRAQAEYEARLPDEEVSVTGSVQTYLLDGPHAEKHALLEYNRDDLIAAFDMATNEELDLDEIHETDINRGIEALIEIFAYHGK